MVVLLSFLLPNILILSVSLTTHLASPEGLQSASATKTSKMKMLSQKKEKEAKKRKRHIKSYKKRISIYGLVSLTDKEYYKGLLYFYHNYTEQKEKNINDCN